MPNQALQPRLQRAIWASGCRSWYLNADGRNVTTWPGFTFEFWARTRRLNANVLEFDPAPMKGDSIPPRTRPVPTHHCLTVADHGGIAEEKPPNVRAASSANLPADERAL